MLVFIMEEKWHAFDVYLPGAIQSVVIDFCQMPNGGGEVLGETYRAIEGI